MALAFVANNRPKLRNTTLLGLFSFWISNQKSAIVLDTWGLRKKQITTHCGILRFLWEGRMLCRLIAAISIVATAVQFGGSTNAMAQSLSSAETEQLLSWSPDEDFQAYIENKFADSKLAKELRFDRLASVVAVPLANLDALSLDDLAGGVLIGGLYLSTGSTRLQLGPGIYLVAVRFDQESYGWKVDHLNSGTGEVIATIDARVEPASTMKEVVSYVDHSVCYRADSWVTCY